MTSNNSTRRPKAVLSNPSDLLLFLSVLGLIILNLAHLAVGTVAAAVALAVFVVAYATRWHTPSVGFYGLVIAELSAIGLQVDLTTVVVYQALCMLLLTSIVAPFPRIGKPRTYVMSALITAGVAAVSLVPGIALASARWLTTVQAGALSGVIVLGVAFALSRTRAPVLVQRHMGA